MKINRIANLNCLDYLNNVPNKFVDLIVIDPPYNELPKKWDNFKSWKNLKYHFSRILKEHGQVYIFGKQPMLSNVYFEFQDQFDFRFELIWNKGKGLWTTNHAPMRSHELIWCFKHKTTKVNKLFFDINSIKTPGKPYVRKNKVISSVRNNWAANLTIYKDGNRFPKTVINEKPVIRRNQSRNTKHPTEKPESILEWIIKSSSKKKWLVLDCFMGSGTTAAVAKKLSRNFIGCEIDKTYFKYSLKRLDLIK